MLTAQRKIAQTRCFFAQTEGTYNIFIKISSCKSLKAKVVHDFG